METYVGIIRSPQDAITLFEACRLGLLPRVCRRLSEKERQNIKSGSVFVWDEREAGMRRWTDGKSWSASRVSGSFLTYREMEGKRNGASSLNPARTGRTPDTASRGSDDGDQANNDESPDGYRYKPDGLMKQSFSITTSAGQHLHLISYYSRHAPAQAHLKQPTSDVALRHIKPTAGMYPESSVQDSHSMPAVTRSPMPSTGLTHQHPTVPGYANFRGPYAGVGPHPPPPTVGQYGPPPPQIAAPPPGYPAVPPLQVGPNSIGQPGPGYPGHPPPSQQGYWQNQLPPPPPPPPPHGAAPSMPPKDGISPSHLYRPGELPPVTGFAQGAGLAPPRNTTPPGEVGRALHSRAGSAGSYQQAYYPSPRSAYSVLTPQPSMSSHPSQNNSPASTPPAPSYDPRTTIARSPLSQHSPRNLRPEYTTGPSRRSLSPHRTPPTSYLPSASQPPLTQLPQINPPTSAPQPPSASTIPSITSLVNGAPNYEHDRHSRSNSRSPGGGSHPRADEGQFPPSSQWSQGKVDIGEDRRTLNILNKAFQT